jgi:hypothetical protein
MEDKQIITDMLLTKEAFIQYTKQLREETAKRYGMTLEEWDDAVATGKVVTLHNSHYVVGFDPASSGSSSYGA